MYVTLMTTYKSKEVGERIIATLLERKLVACIQEQEIKSHYVWEGKVEHESETLLMMKTKEEHFEAIEACLEKLHEYDVLELVMLPITKGSEKYLNWMDEMLLD